MRTLLIALALQSATVPPPKPPAPAPGGAIEVIRLGDGQLSCEALVAEVNQLSRDLTERERKAAVRVA